MARSEKVGAELTRCQAENAALQQSLATMGAALAQAGRQLEDALAMLTQEQRLLYVRTQQDLEYDALTGIPNRSTFAARLDLSLESARRNPNHRFAVLSIGVDRFRLVNDSLGHLAGNQLLRNIAQRLTSCLRATDIVGRVACESTLARSGGDEFSVLLDNINTVEAAAQVCDRIQSALSAPFLVNGREVYATASIGLALSAASYSSAEEVLRDAEMAMCRAKTRGKGRLQVFDSEMRANALVRWELETDLRHALERHELRVYFQPKVVLATSEVVGFEALLRWEHPKRGLISPLQFIPIAEETELIIPIGEWVLRESCRQIQEWNERFCLPGPLSVSVNLSCCQFTEANLFDRIANAVEDCGIDPRLLWLEITESNLMGNTEYAIEVLGQLKAMGIGLMIDDFGTGYSSLNYLARFPFDTLKIDQSFIRAMDVSPEGGEIVKTMLNLAANLDMHVVAEGIETTSQLEQLHTLGCGYGQGHLFSAPMNVLSIEQLLRNPGEFSRQLAARKPKALVA